MRLDPAEPFLAGVGQLRQPARPEDRNDQVLAPAGNGGANTIDFPASIGSVLAVAGTDLDDHKASFSNYGAGVDIAAPAVGILSTYFGGGYATWSGTSMAVPFVTGAAALLYQEGSAPSPSVASGVVSALLRGARASSEGDPAFTGGLGAGRVDALRSLAWTGARSGGPGGDGFQRRVPSAP